MDKRKFNRVPEDTSQQQKFVEEVIGNINTINDTLPHKADLNEDGKVPAEQLPSYVDDIVEYATRADFPEEGESGKIYVALDTGYSYRWSGSTYTVTSTNPIVKITYADLKQLRDEGKLLPGQSYRIIDYNTTTTKPDTKSAMHQFDIIVVADDEHTLNENARAVYHFDNAKDIKSFYLTAMADSYTRYPAEDGDYEGEHYYAFRGEGDDSSYAYTKSLTEIPTADSVFCFLPSDGLTWLPLSSENISKVQSVQEADKDNVEQIEFNDYFAMCNLSAWQIKYCLDNDTSRFEWANTAEEEGAMYDTICPYVGTYVHDGVMYYEFEYTSPGFGNAFALTRYPMKNDALYFKQDDEMIKDDIFLHDYQFAGKGVIYWMKDEFNNEAPYDFKNILFKRYDVSEFELVEGPHFNDFSQKIEDWFNKVTPRLPYQFYRGYSDPKTGQEAVDEGYPDLLGKTEEEVLNSGLSYCILDDPDWNGDPGLIAQFDADASAYDWFYTFTIRINNVNADKSLTDICRYNKIIATFYNDKITLYDNVFLSTSTSSSCSYNTLNYNCYYNTFGNSVYDNKLNKDCYYNTFGNECHGHVLGDNSYFNIFGDNCRSNTFGNYCNSNIFDEACYGNSFVGFCSYNDFDVRCKDNTFGTSCRNNTFAADCNYNTFGNECNNNTFDSFCDYNILGNECSYNKLAKYCTYNRFDNNAHHNEIELYSRWNVFETGVEYVSLEGTTPSSSSLQIQNVKIHQGIKGTSSHIIIITMERNLAYETNLVPTGTVMIEI